MDTKHLTANNPPPETTLRVALRLSSHQILEKFYELTTGEERTLFLRSCGLSDVEQEQLWLCPTFPDKDDFLKRLFGNGHKPNRSIAKQGRDKGKLIDIEVTVVPDKQYVTSIGSPLAALETPKSPEFKSLPPHKVTRALMSAHEELLKKDREMRDGQSMPTLLTDVNLRQIACDILQAYDILQDRSANEALLKKMGIINHVEFVVDELEKLAGANHRQHRVDLVYRCLHKIHHSKPSSKEPVYTHEEINEVLKDLMSMKTSAQEEPDALDLLSKSSVIRETVRDGDFSEGTSNTSAIAPSATVKQRSQKRPKKRTLDGNVLTITNAHPGHDKCGTVSLSQLERWDKDARQQPQYTVWDGAIQIEGKYEPIRIYLYCNRAKQTAYVGTELKEHNGKCRVNWSVQMLGSLPDRAAPRRVSVLSLKRRENQKLEESHMNNEFDGVHVKAVTPEGKMVEIELVESMFENPITEQLICNRIWHGGIVCRGRWDAETKSVRPKIKDGKPVVLNVHTPTCQGLVESLERDQFEIKQMLKGLTERRWAVALAYGRSHRKRGR